MDMKNEEAEINRKYIELNKRKYTELFGVLKKCSSNPCDEQLDFFNQNFLPIIVEAGEEYENLLKKYGINDQKELELNIKKFKRDLAKKSGLYASNYNTVGNAISRQIPTKEKDQFIHWLKDTILKEKNSPKFLAQKQVADGYAKIEEEINALKIIRNELEEKLEEINLLKPFEELRAKQQKSTVVQKKLQDNLQSIPEAKRKNLEERLEKEKIEYEKIVADLQEIEKNDLIIQYLQVKANIDQLRNNEELTDAKNNLSKQNAEAGRQKGLVGLTFEEISRNIILQQIVPIYSEGDENAGTEEVYESGKSMIKILHSVTLGMAAAEIDYVIVRCHLIALETKVIPTHFAKMLKNAIKTNSTLVAFEVEEVLAIIECKSNAKDVTHNITKMQTMISWLTQQPTPSENIGTDVGYYYDIATWKSTYYRDGHFSKPAYHVDKATEEVYVFKSEAFTKRFVRSAEDQLYKDNIYYLVRRGFLDIPSNVLQSILCKSVNSGVDESNEAGLETIWKWCVEENVLDESLRALEVAKRMKEVALLRVIPWDPCFSPHTERDDSLPI